MNEGIGTEQSKVMADGRKTINGVCRQKSLFRDLNMPTADATQYNLDRNTALIICLNALIAVSRKSAGGTDVTTHSSLV